MLPARVIDVATPQDSRQLSGDLHHVMATLDRVGILHNDGNVRNLMLDDDDRLYIIDFGLAKEITPAVRKKWNGAPNINVTLRMLRNGLKKYKLTV